jgi:Domain of unknown function (DUF4440)
MWISSKALLIILGVFLLTTCLAQSNDDEQQVRTAVKNVRQALLQRDSNALEQLYGDDFTVHYSDGSTEDKTGRIKGVTSHSPVPFLNISDEKIKLYGTTAVVTGIASSSKDAPSQRFMQVWVKRDGRWQEVALSLISIQSEVSH